MRSFFALFFMLTSFSLHAAITIGAYNIRNFDYDERARIHTDKPALANILRSLNVDVLSVEEIHNTAKWDEFVATQMPGFDTEVSRCGGAHGQSLGFLFNKTKVELLSFNEDMSIVEPGRPGGCNVGSRPLAIGLFEIRATKQRFYGMTAHLKSGSDPAAMAKRLKQYQIIKKIINELRAKTGVRDFYVAGDFNTTEYLSRGADYAQLTAVVRDLGMIDLAQNLPCTAYWWGGTNDQIETPSMLDHIIATPGLIRTKPQTFVHGHCQKVSCRQVPIRDLGVSYAGVSDHCPITATIQ